MGGIHCCLVLVVAVPAAPPSRLFNRRGGTTAIGYWTRTTRKIGESHRATELPAHALMPLIRSYEEPLSGTAR